ncbi:hypothetical protein GCM10009111_00730 [Colwellia asteriadis]|uniref:Uncharacterized protein n=1 Tax=Colwellia asteriadis TaxID=517723 RepID=A0ABN1L249_9GAMM
MIDDSKIKMPLCLIVSINCGETINDATGSPENVTSKATQKNILEKSVAIAALAREVTTKTMRNL